MKQAHQTFIIEMIKHADKTMAYQKAYPKCTDAESARKSAERLLRHHPEVTAEIEEATAYIRQRAYAEAYHLHTEQQKVPLLSILKKREILTQLATCEMKVGRYIKDGDRYKLIFEDPRPRDIIKAIEVDTRLEEMCNRARNIHDPQLSQFNIYIDGRPCDDPTAPVNPDLPPGLLMLPRTRKKLNPEQGNKTEQNQETPLLGGVGVSLLAQEKTPIAEQGNNLEQIDLSPAGGEPALNLIQGGDVRAGGGIHALEKSPIKEQGNNPEQIHNTSPLPEVPIAIGIGVPLPPEPPPLYPQYLALHEKRQLRATDLLGASLYKQDKAAEASAPPSRILTDEEVRELIAEADRKQENQKQPPKQQYNTLGKMYFPPEGR